jgi:hypothetical protein
MLFADKWGPNECMGSDEAETGDCGSVGRVALFGSERGCSRAIWGAHKLIEEFARGAAIPGKPS